MDTAWWEYNDDLSTNERIEGLTVRIITGRRCWLWGKDRPYHFNRNAGGAAVRFAQKKQLLILAVVNIITQIILNVLLNVD
ncbi:MAG: hypothetical protein ACLTR6_01170 [Clostridium fessum]